MGRSVSYARGSVFKVYATVDCEYPEDWEDLLDGLRYGLAARLPSLKVATGWRGNEDRVLVSNRLADIGISEYCGLVCVWGVPREWADEALATHWLEQVEEAVAHVVAEVAGGTLQSLGYASNGEQFFTRGQA